MSRMVKVFIFLMIGICLFLTSIASGHEMGVKGNDERDSENQMHLEKGLTSVQIFIWEVGTRRNLDKNQQWVVDLVGLCLDLFTSADDVLKEAVTEWTIKRVKNGKALEVLFAKPIDFTVGVRHELIKSDGLLIPLKPFNHNNAVIYYRLGNYSAGPLLNINGADLIGQMIKLLKKNSSLTK